MKFDAFDIIKAKRKSVPKNNVDIANNALDINHVDILLVFWTSSTCIS